MLIKTGYPQLRNRKELSLLIDKFGGGSNNLLSEDRLKKNEAAESKNLILVEDGLWQKRWGTGQYGGVLWTNSLDGFTEFRKSDGTRELIVVADGKVWRVNPSASTKTEITGATFTTGNKVKFQQAGGNLYIINGNDPIGLYDGSTLYSYTPLDTPGTISLSRTTLTAGSYTFYYRVVAVNGIGTSTPSAEASITVNKERDAWTGGEAIVLDVADVSGALKYVWYMSDTSGYEVKLAETQISTYTDDGTAVPNPYIEPPTDDSTAGAKISSICFSGNRIWGCGDPDHPQRVYGTGVGVNLGNFSPAYGGFWVDLERGGRSVTVSVRDYQGEAHVFCKTDDGKGAIWKIPVQAESVGSTTFIVPVPQKLISATGTIADRSVVYVENDIFYFNQKGVRVLGNEPGVLGILRTNELSSKIRPYIQSLVGDSIGLVCAYYYDAKVFFSVPTTTGDPDRTIYFDRERNVLVKDWTIGVSQFGEFTDSSDVTRLLGISGNKLIEFSPNYNSDSGTAFQWRYKSPRFSSTGIWKDHSYLQKSHIKLRSGRGSINFGVLGTKLDDEFTQIKSKTITLTAGATPSGIGWDAMGGFRLGTTNGTRTNAVVSETTKYINVDKVLRDFQYIVEGNAAADTAIIVGIYQEANDAPQKPNLSGRLD
jgi:hypothetical protein